MLFAAACARGGAQTAPAPAPAPAATPPPAVHDWQGEDLAIATRFAPVFHQALAGDGRYDFITNFDFDGDWIGDNNWDHAEDHRYPLKAYVYYVVSETQSHYFIHYAVFHPRDWKGGATTGRALSRTTRETVTLHEMIRPRGIIDDLVLSHENDFEGALVVVDKTADALPGKVALVETVAHNKFLRFEPSADPESENFLRMDGDRPVLWIEPKGHGVRSQPKSESGARRLFGKLKAVRRVQDVIPGVPDSKEDPEPGDPTRVYQFTGTADDPILITVGPVGYELVPLYDTLWKHSQEGRNGTYGEVHDYGELTVSAASGSTKRTIKAKIGSIGSAFRGLAGAANKARPPWGWFDRSERDRPLGEWFFDPANVLMRRLHDVKNWSTTYLHEPMLGILREATTGDRKPRAGTPD